MTVPRERRFGSLSGLARDERTGRYLAVIDDRLPARVAWLDIKYIDGRLSVTPLGVEPVTAGPGVDPRIAVQADLEAVVALPDGSFVGSEEGHISQGRGRSAAGRHLASGAADAVADDGGHRRAPLAGGVQRRAGGRRHPRQPGRRGADAHARRPPDRRARAAAVRRSARRLPERTSVQRRAGRPRPPGGVRRHGWALAGAAAVDVPDRAAPKRARASTPSATTARTASPNCWRWTTRGFLSLERACLQNAATRVARNTGHLFLVDLSGADDVSGIASLASASVQGAAKTLLVDFDALIPRLPAHARQPGQLRRPRVRADAAGRQPHAAGAVGRQLPRRRRRRCCCCSG